ncbi:MAG: hypothetical protein JJE04_19650 [Acidobacteriia bacterium]|nr:hypothetical protein [Terriglobia bacterium]
MKDYIVEEVRRIREEHAERFGYDVDAIFAELKRLEKASGQRRVSFGAKRLAKAGIKPSRTRPPGPAA